MINQYKQYLISRKFREFTPSGNRSTVFDYVGRIQRVCAFEELTLNQLAEKIDEILPQYEFTGEKSMIGKRSHESVVNALRHFKAFSRLQGTLTLNKVAK